MKTKFGFAVIHDSTSLNVPKQGVEMGRRFFAVGEEKVSQLEKGDTTRKCVDRRQRGTGKQ